MLRLRKVAVTGGISCGKSLFCHSLKKLGAFVVSADDIVHQLLSPQTDLGKQVVHLLGPSILRNGEIDREAIAEQVFQDRKLLVALEKIVHPFVSRQLSDDYSKAEKEGRYTLFVAEIPLLFETGMEKLFDTTVTVLADEALCLQRFIAKTGKTKEEFFRRSQRQLSPQEKANKSDVVITNNGTEEELFHKAEQLTLTLKRSLKLQ